MSCVIEFDMHKRETQAYIVDESGKLCAKKRFRTLHSLFRRVLSKYPDGDVIIESVCFDRPVERWFKDLGYTVQLAHTGRIPKPGRPSRGAEPSHNRRQPGLSGLPMGPQGTNLSRDV